MPCCCSSNIKAAKILGIILAVIYGLGIVWDFTKFSKGISNEVIFSLITGFLGLASASILAYGGFSRSSKAMQIYIYSTIFMIILSIAGAVWVIVAYLNLGNSVNLSKFQILANQKTCNQYRGTSNYQVCLDLVDDEFDKIDEALITAGPIGLIVVVVIAVLSILFDIWTIFVAKNAKKEIEAEM